MDNKHTKISFEDEDFEAIEEAVLETERGRWFLAEYAARNRRSETTTLLASIAKLERVVAGELHQTAITTSTFSYKTLAADLETLIGAIALPHHHGKDPVEGLATDISANAFALAGLADKIRDQIDSLAIAGLPAEPILSMTQSVNQIISLSARQNNLGRQVEALAKVFAFCRDRLALAHSNEENLIPQDYTESPAVASFNALRRKVLALSEAE